jgi:hypothetical protein
MLRRLAPVLAFASCIAATVILIGPSDLESYDTAFFSLDRGTAVQSEHVLGHPVYTLSLGLGLRLPLHGSLGASPAAALAPYLPMPFAYGLLLVCAIASAVVVVRCALEPICGRLVSWFAIAHLFCSLPIVTYTIASDWPEIAVAYMAIVACVFAPHALLAARGAEGPTARRVVWLSVAGLVWSLVSVAHSGYWPHLAATLVCGAALALCRWDHPLRARVAAIATLALVASVPVALQAPDILRELTLAGTDGVRRYVQGPVGNVFSANLFPLVQVGARMPFTNLMLAFVALAIGVQADNARDRWLIVGSAIASVLLGIGASTLPPGAAVFAPSNTWAMRDYAGAFALFSGACAAGALVRSTHGRASRGRRALLVALALASLQGPLYAWRLVVHEIAGGGDPGWTRELSSAETRMLRRGVSRDLLQPGARLALWPGARGRMRGDRANTADFPDAGYELVTTGVKDRTMRGLIEPNDLLFNQSTDLPSEVLCDAPAVQFLQLRYLLTPRGVTCQPWRPVDGAVVDSWLEVQTATARDDQARAVPVAQVDAVAQTPAFSGSSPVVSGFSRTSVSPLLSALVALPGTSLRVGPREVVVRADEVSRFRGQAIVLPVAYDSAWTSSSGQVRSVGGLLAVVSVDQPSTTLTFVPDAAAILLALGMTVAQLLACGGLIGLGTARPAPILDDALIAHERIVAGLVQGWSRRVSGIVVPAVRCAIAVALPALREPQNLLCLLFSAAVIARPQRADQIDLFTALLLPLTSLAVARAAHWRWLRSWIGVTVLATALVRVALGGSRAAAALHDPLFWAIVAFVCAGVAVFTGRWPIAAVTASAGAGAAAAVATLLPYVPNFDVAFPTIDPGVVGRSLTAISDQLGVAATVCLIALWVHAIAFTWRHNRTDGVSAGARAALFAALVLCLAGALTTRLIVPAWVATLGLLIGATETLERLREDGTEGFVE